MPLMMTRQGLPPLTEGASVKTAKPALQVTTLNVPGLGDNKKVRHLIDHCSSDMNSIFMFQETYIYLLDLLNYIWQGQHHLTTGNRNILVCITLLTAPLKITHRVDVRGRGHIMVLSNSDVNKAEIIIANVHAPKGFDNVNWISSKR